MTLSAALCAALGTAIVLLELLLGLLKGPELGLVLSASTGGPLGPPWPSARRPRRERSAVRSPVSVVRPGIALC